jgi:hypothetical protein
MQDRVSVDRRSEVRGLVTERVAGQTKRTSKWGFQKRLGDSLNTYIHSIAGGAVQTASVGRNSSTGVLTLSVKWVLIGVQR